MASIRRLGSVFDDAARCNNFARGGYLVRSHKVAFLDDFSARWPDLFARLRVLVNRCTLYHSAQVLGADRKHRASAKRVTRLIVERVQRLLQHFNQLCLGVVHVLCVDRSLIDLVGVVHLSGLVELAHYSILGVSYVNSVNDYVLLNHGQGLLLVAAETTRIDWQLLVLL